jgi:hypothetical protein
MSDDQLAAEIESVGSCDSDVRGEDELQAQSLAFDKMYLKTHVGSCLQTVLQQMMAKGDINVVQKSELEQELNRIYYSAFSHCQRKLRLNIHADLNEYASVDTGSYFNIQNCVINGPASSVKVPQGEARFMYAHRL